MARILTARLIIGVAVAATLCPGSAGARERPWLVLENPYFRVWTDAPEKRALELADELDRYRLAVQRVTNLKVPPEAPRTRVLILGRGFEEFTAERGVRAYAVRLALAGDAEPRMLIVMPARVRDLDDLQAARHEYVHVLTSHGLLKYPWWYNEGIAEVVSHVDVDGAMIKLGLPAKRRLDAYRTASGWAASRWLSFDRIVAGDFEENRQVYSDPYLQAWFLVHYLTFGTREFLPQLERCLIYSDGGMPPLQAFELAFGMSPETLWDDHISKSYEARIPALGFSLSEPLRGEPFVIEAADPDEIRWVMDGLAEFVAQARTRASED